MLLFLYLSKALLGGVFLEIITGGVFLFCHLKFLVNPIRTSAVDLRIARAVLMAAVGRRSLTKAMHYIFS